MGQKTWYWVFYIIIFCSHMATVHYSLAQYKLSADHWSYKKWNKKKTVRKKCEKSYDFVKVNSPNQNRKSEENRFPLRNQGLITNVK